jgi:phage gp36-like protein
MTAYATLSDMTDRFGTQLLMALTDRGVMATGEVDEALVNKALADATEQIDGYLRAAGYLTPLADVPGNVADICLSIAGYKLYITEAPEKIVSDYKDALRALEAISKGVIKLAVAGIEPPSTGGTGVRVTDRERPLTEATMKGFI